MQLAKRPGSRAVPILLILCGLLHGCRTLSRFCPADQQVIAAREMSRSGLDALQGGRLHDAEARLQHALRECPHDAEARRSLAQVYLARGMPKEAVEQMDLAVRYSAGDSQWTVDLGRMLLEQGNHAVALECSERALATAPQLGAAWALRGDALLARQDLIAAHDAFHRALTVSQPEKAVLLPLASIYEQQGRPQRALATLRRYEDEIPEHKQVPDLAIRQGVLLQALARHDQALAKFVAGMRTSGQTPDLLLKMAQSELALGKQEAADHWIAAARELQPDHPQLATLSTAVRTVSHDQPTPEIKTHPE